MAHRVPDPFGRLHCAKLVKHEHFGVEYRLENLQFCRLNAGIVRVLYLLQQLAIVVEEARGALLNHELAQDSDSQMRLTHADRSKQHQAGALDRILLHEPIRLEERIRQAAVGSRKIRVKIRKRAMFIARRNARFFQQPLRPVADATLAASDALRLRGSCWDGFPTGSTALGASFNQHKTRFRRD